MDGNLMNAFVKATLVALLGCISVSPAVGSQDFTLQFAVVLFSDSTSTEATSTYSTVDNIFSYDGIRVTATDMTSEETSSFPTTAGTTKPAQSEIAPIGRKLQNYVAAMDVSLEETLNFLDEVYTNTTEFLGLIDVEWTYNTDICGGGKECCYNVTYNWIELKPNFSELIPALMDSQQLIEKHGEDFNIDPVETAELPINKLDNITEQVACTAYNLEEGCGCGFVSKGKCNYDSSIDLAFCSCVGWGLMEKSFISDGKCYSVDAIIAITVGGVSLILLILLITICCLSCNIAKLEDEVESLKESQDDEYLFSDPPKEQTVQNPAYEKNWQNPVLMSDVQAADTLDSSTDDAHPQLNGYHKYGAKKRNSDLYMPEPHEMGAYNKSYLPEPGAPWESTVTNSQDMTESEAYKNFKASLDHIDPNANYNIRRPNLSIRPTNGMYEVPKRSDVPSFRI